MRFLLRLPLTVLIPAILVVFSTFASIWVAVESLNKESADIEEQFMQRVQHEMPALQAAISHNMINGDMEGAYSMLTTQSSRADLQALFVADENDLIIMSTRFEWTGMKASEIKTNYDPSIAGSIKNSMHRNIKLTADRMSVLGYFPIVLGTSAGEIRPSRVGVLFAEYDLTNLKAEARWNAVVNAAKFWLPFAALILGLWLLLYMFITRRLAALVNQTKRIASGDLEARSFIEGADEIAALARTLDHMADSLAEGHMRLLAEINKKESTEEELRKFLRAIEHSADTVVITDTKGSIEYVNPNFFKTTGYSEDEVMGKNPRILKSGYTPDDEYRKMWEVISSGGEWHGVFHNKKKDGTLYWESAAISPIKNEKGEIINYVAVKQDITERMKSEEELKKKERLTILGQVAGSITHELRNPLNTMHLAAEVLAMNLPEPEKVVKDCIETIKSEIMVCEGIISSLLDSVRTKTPKLMTISVAEIVEMSLSRCDLPEKIALTVDIQPSLPPLLVDIQHIRQVLINLINNAVQAMPGRGSLRIGAGRDGEFIKIVVSDTGGGITAENMKKLFQPLFTTKKEGTGLGLMVVKNLTEVNGGRIEVHSEVGKGTDITLIFPAHVKN